MNHWMFQSCLEHFHCPPTLCCAAKNIFLLHPLNTKCYIFFLRFHDSFYASTFPRFYHDLFRAVPPGIGVSIFQPLMNNFTPYNIHLFESKQLLSSKGSFRLAWRGWGAGFNLPGKFNVPLLFRCKNFSPFSVKWYLNMSLSSKPLSFCKHLGCLLNRLSINKCTQRSSMKPFPCTYFRREILDLFYLLIYLYFFY